MPSPTPNKGYTYPAHGGAVNAWDAPLNTDFDTIDANLGGSYRIAVGSSIAGTTFNSTGALVNNAVATITLPAANAANLNYQCDGVMGTNVNLIFPAAGGLYTIENQFTGAFTLTTKTPAGTGVTITQGSNNVIVCDGINIQYAHSAHPAEQLESYLGDPNTNVAGTVATVNGDGTDFRWDVTDWQLYAATTTGNAATTVWTPQLARLFPEGYLTVSATADSPIITADTTATSIKYVPYIGNWTVLSNGTVLYPYQFSAMTLTLTASQAANILYDIFMYDNSTAGVISPVIGTGPAWSISTAGSCSRGSGAGTTELSRFQGIWTNKVQVTLTNGASTYTCPANRGIYLGSIFIDSAAGNVTCHRSYGQSRKWGVWNAFNRIPVYLKTGDPTASWTYAVAAIRASNGDSNNKVTAFMGLAEEPIDTKFDQFINFPGGAGSVMSIGIGLNSTTVMTGTKGSCAFPTAGSWTSIEAVYETAPLIGINNFNCLEFGAAGPANMNGTEANMVLLSRWRA